MCLSPIRIRNNSRSFEKGFAPLYHEVPCGKCYECQTSIQNDWFVRLAFEYYHIKKVNGLVYMITLTFNDKNIPYFDVDKNVFDVLSSSLARLCLENDKVAQRRQDFDFEHKDIVSAFDYLPFSHCYFDYKQFSKFLKSLRQYFHQQKIYDYKEDTVKFFLAPEYGENFHRVHVHMLAFLPFQISPADFKFAVSYCWSKTVKRTDLPDFMVECLENRSSLKNGVTNISTPNGKDWCDWFVKKIGNHIYVKNLIGKCEYSKKHPPVIQSAEGLRYVVKYVSKKDEYLSSEKFSLLEKYLKIFPRKLDDYENRYPLMCKYVKILRSYFPHVHCSNLLGISILDEFKVLHDEQIVKALNEPYLHLPYDVRLYRVPAYIVNRIMYDKDNLDPTLRKLSYIGVKVLKYRLDLRIDEFEKQLNVLTSVKTTLLSVNDIASVQKEFSCLFDVFTLRPSFRDLAIYKYFFQNVEIPSHDFRCADRQVVYDTFYADYWHKKVFRRYDVECPPNLCECQHIKCRSEYTWNYQPCFEYFDKWLEYYDALRFLFNKRKAQYRQKEYFEKLKYRKFYDSMIYSPY